MLTEEGLPHFHRLLAVYLGDESHWRRWNNLWTAEEDRHGQVLHDYARDTRLFDQRKIEEMQFEYLRNGFHPDWDRDPYRVFAYTTVQERATQFSHGETGRIVGEYEPRLAEVLSQVAKDEARHYAFYRSVFELILERDPNQALHSASFILPAIDMPGVTMPGFKELADVIRRSGHLRPERLPAHRAGTDPVLENREPARAQRAGTEGAGKDRRHSRASAPHRRAHGDQEPREDVQLRGGVQPRIRDGMSRPPPGCSSCF